MEWKKLKSMFPNKRERVKFKDKTAYMSYRDEGDFYNIFCMVWGFNPSGFDNIIFQKEEKLYNYEEAEKKHKKLKDECEKILKK